MPSMRRADHSPLFAWSIATSRGLRSQPPSLSPSIAASPQYIIRFIRCRLPHRHSPRLLAASPSPSYQRGPSSVPSIPEEPAHADDSRAGGHVAAAADAGYGGEAAAGGVQPEAEAVAWAARNAWFGTDMEMTEMAYMVHDRLVINEGVLPSSPAYYQVRRADSSLAVAVIAQGCLLAVLELTGSGAKLSGNRARVRAARQPAALSTRRAACCVIRVAALRWY